MSEAVIKFKPVEKKLESGAEITIRECTADDAENLTRCILQYISESEHIPLTLEEFDTSMEYRTRWIESFRNEENSLMLVVIHNDLIIGNMDIRGGHRKRFRHTGITGMGLRKEWRGIGLGSLLLDSAIEWAKNNPSLEILWMQVYATNEAGIKLYEKKGFVQMGMQPDFIKLDDNTYVNNLIMQLPV
jgi:ribosomal protein S18 acetylase RimI-like enzyme